MTLAQHRRAMALVRGGGPVSPRQMAEVRALAGQLRIAVVFTLLSVLLLAALPLTADLGTVHVLLAVTQAALALYLLDGVHRARGFVAAHSDRGSAGEGER